MKTRANKFLKTLFKVFGLVFVLILIAAVVGLSVGYIVRTREVSRLKNLYKTAESNLNEDLEENQTTIESLEKSFQNMKNENESLKKQVSEYEEELKKQEIEGFGKINGEILPFIVGDENFNQYQVVCAESVNNNKVRFCLTVQASKKQFSLNVPKGSYYVFATIDTTNETLKGYKAYYTEYIKCTEEKDPSECNVADLTAPVEIKIEASRTVGNVDPIDWKKS
jgi:predicted Holliday junction resolvase-like endonuclease